MSATEDQFDVLIRNGQLYDGTGIPPRAGDIGIRSGRIAGIGDLTQAIGDEEIDASGLAVAPGFIDTHTHDDLGLLTDPDMSCKVSQGVTTVVTGNCGFSIAPVYGDRRPPFVSRESDEPGQFRFETVDAYFDALDKAPAAANSVFLVGHGTLRANLMPSLAEPASASEISAMRSDVRAAMKAGAWGLSTGLFYPGSRAAPTEEVMALCEEVAPFGGIYATHIRDEGAKLEESVDEALDIAKHAGIAAVLSHHKASGAKHHGKVVKTLLNITARSRDQKIGLDVYPYIAGSTMLMPARTMEAAKILITWSEPMPEASGRDLQELADEHGVALDEMAERLQPAGAIYFTLSEEDVQRVLSYPESMIGSDGLFHDQHPHPRLWGTFPRVLGHYAREMGLMPMEEAVRRMTGLPAEKLGLEDRGIIQDGAIADLTLFDPATVIDTATFDNPIQASDGIHTVMTAGRPVWQNGKPTGQTPGNLIRCVTQE